MDAGEPVTTRRLADREGDQTPLSEIVSEGVPTGVFVTGAVLEFARRWHGFHLLLLSDDIPSEDFLGIHLFDRELKLLDSAFVGGPYSTGSFRQVEWLDSGRLSFRFSGNVIWNLRLLDRPALRPPFMGDARGVRRRFGFSRHFVVSASPSPSDPGGGLDGAGG